MEVFDILVFEMLSQTFKGVRGTTVAIGRLDRDKECHFQTKQKVDNISSLNNFEYSKDGSVVAHRQFDIGLGRVNVCYMLIFL